MTETRDGLVERLAKRADNESSVLFDDRKSEARWWPLAIADAWDEEGDLSDPYYNDEVSRWLRTEAERR